MAETTDVTGSVLYSEKVTADTLNNIATDLITASINDEEGSEESPLGPSTFGLFDDKKTYAVNQLNDITAALVTKGILNIGKKCQVLNPGTNDYISVSDGVCVFGDGSKVRINEGETATVSFIEGYTNYVYLVKHVTDNKVMLYNSIFEITDEFGADYYVPLAKVIKKETDENEEPQFSVSDRRIWSCAKYCNYDGKNKTDTKTISLTFPTGENKNAYTYHTVYFDLAYSGYNYVYSDYDDQDAYVYIGDDKEHFFLDESNASVWVQKQGDKLYVKTGTWSLKPPKTITAKIKLF